MDGHPQALAVRLPVRDVRQDFEVLLEAESASILGLCRRLLGDPEEARDLAQEALVRAYESLAAFRGECSLKTWVCRIAIRQGMRRLHRRRLRERLWHRWRQETPVVATAPGDDPEEAAAARAGAARLELALRSLPVRQRTALVLRYLEGLSVAEIAHWMDIGPGSVKTHLVRGLRALRDLLPASGEENGHESL